VSTSRLFHNGMNLDLLISRFKEIGGDVRPVRRTGEIRMTHPSSPSPVTLNGRRKDAPRHAIHYALRIMTEASKNRH
jgi:hypothetical protein